MLYPGIISSRNGLDLVVKLNERMVCAAVDEKYWSREDTRAQPKQKAKEIFNGWMLSLVLNTINFEHEILAYFGKGCRRGPEGLQYQLAPEMS